MLNEKRKPTGINPDPEGPIGSTRDEFRNSCKLILTKNDLRIYLTLYFRDGWLVLRIDLKVSIKNTPVRKPPTWAYQATEPPTLPAFNN